MEKNIIDYDFKTRFAVARNKDTREDVLEILSKDSNARVRAEVAANENTPHYILDEIVKETNGIVRVALATNINLDDNFIEKLSNDIYWKVRLKIGSHERVSNEILQKLGKDKDFKVRASIPRKFHIKLKSLDDLDLSDPKNANDILNIVLNKAFGVANILDNKNLSKNLLLKISKLNKRESYNGQFFNLEEKIFRNKNFDLDVFESIVKSSNDLKIYFILDRSKVSEVLFSNIKEELRIPIAMNLVEKSESNHFSNYILSNGISIPIEAIEKYIENKILIINDESTFKDKSNSEIKNIIKNYSNKIYTMLEKHDVSNTTLDNILRISAIPTHKNGLEELFEKVNDILSSRNNDLNI